MARITVDSPFAVLIDTAEQLPYSFTGLRADADQKNLPLIVTTKRLNLIWGDYSIDGYANKVAVERKNERDLYCTITEGRERFLRELEALNEYDAAWVVVEKELGFFMDRRNKRHNGEPYPKSIWRSVMAFQLNFPRVHWWACPGREAAEGLTYQLLRKWWQKRIERPKANERRRLRWTK